MTQVLSRPPTQAQATPPAAQAANKTDQAEPNRSGSDTPDGTSLGQWGQQGSPEATPNPANESPKDLEQLLEHRGPTHRKGLTQWVLAARGSW